MNMPEPTADPFADFASHRVLATELYKRCVREDSAAPLQNFLELLISVHPPPMALLHAIHDDLNDHASRLRLAEYNASLAPLSMDSPQADRDVPHELQITYLLKDALTDWLRALCILQARYAQAANPAPGAVADGHSHFFNRIL